MFASEDHNHMPATPDSLTPNATAGEIDVFRRQDLLQVFVILLTLFTVGDFIAAPTKNLLDSAILENLDNDLTNNGKIRLWRNTSQIFLYLIVSPIVKLSTVKVCNVPIQDDYGLIMFPLSFLMLCAFTVGLKVNFKQDERNKSTKDTMTTETQKTPVKYILLNFRSITFFIIVLYFGIVEGIFTTFMFWYLTDVSPFQSTWVIAVAGASRVIG